MTCWRLASAIGWVLCVAASAAAQPRPARPGGLPRPGPPPPPTHDIIRVFLDCGRCDENYLKSEVTFIDYVRNREDADVHVLVTTQQTGSGGTQYTLKFIGLGRFRGADQSLMYSTTQTATPDETRKGFAEVFKIGLVRYVAETTMGDRLRVSFQKPPQATAARRSDPWNYWVFRANFGGNFNGEQSNTGKSLRGSFSANRTTDAWRASLSASANYRDSKFLLDEVTGETVLSVTRSTDTSGLIVKSLTEHWSAGLVGSVSSSTFRNYDWRVRLAPGIEYDVFPYSQSTRRMLTLQYTVGVDANDYTEETVFDKLRERLLDHHLDVGLSLRQPWGTIATEMNFSQFLNRPDKYSLGTFGSANVRLFKGFSFNAFAEFSRPHDQIFLARGAATTEEILLRQRQLATNYEYFVNFGISYSFGSIFNNVVNPRFGGAGGFDF